MGGHGAFWNAVCGVLSVEKYDTGRYACNRAALEGMKAAGLFYDQESLARSGDRLPDLLRDTDFLNEQLGAIFAQSPAAPSEKVVGLGWGFDSGYMDFVDLAFQVFGKEIGSPYYLYFLLLSMSSLVFIICFNNSLFSLLILYLFHYTLNQFVALDLLDAWSLESVTNPRFLTTLAIVPVLHLTLLLLCRARPSVMAFSLALPQAALMVFAANLRTSAFWTVIALTLFCIVLWAVSRRRDALIRCWPGGMVVALTLAAAIFVGLSSDPRLAEQGWTRNHGFWSSVYYSLQHHPDWQRKSAALHGGTTGDGPALAAVQAYMDRHGLSDDKSAFRDDGYLRNTHVERYLRGAFFEFLAKDPTYVLETFLVYNSLSIFNLSHRGFAWSLIAEIGWGFATLLLFFAAAGVIEIQRGRDTLPNMAAGCGVLAALALLAAAPNWATVVIIDSMHDASLMAGIAAMVAIYVALVGLGLFGLRALSGMQPSRAEEP